MDNDIESIEKYVEAIYDKADKWEAEGRNAFECGWQATLEIMLLLVDRYISAQPGQLVPMEIENQDEWEFYLDIKKKLDLPPETCAVLVTPSAFKKMPAMDVPGIDDFGPKAWERNAYSLIISDLTKNTWIHFNPEGTWTDELIVRYTENWFAKSMEIDLQNSEIHEEFSYLHHPELVNLPPFEAVFRAVGGVMPRKFGGLQNIVDAGNSLNQDLELGQPVMTKKGILENKNPECRALLDYVKMEIESLLENLEHIDGVKFPLENRNTPGYRKLFDETAFKFYKAVTGQP